MTAVPTTFGAELFVTNVLNGTVAANGATVNRGTVVRIDVLILPFLPPLRFSTQVITTGFAERTDPAAKFTADYRVAMGRSIGRVLGTVGLAAWDTFLDAVEARFPVLRGTIREHGTLKRRPLVRFFACEDDLSHDDPDKPLPEAVAKGVEPFFIIGAIAGG